MNVMIYTVFYPAPPELRTKPDTLIVHYFAQALQKAGHQVQVVLLSVSRLPCILENRFRDILPSEADYVYEGVPVHLFRFQALIPYLNYPHRWQAAYINSRLRVLKETLGWKPDKVFVHFPSVFTGVTEIFADGVPVLGDFHNMDISILNKAHGKKVAAFIKEFDTWGYRNRRVRQGLEAVENRNMAPVYSGIDVSLLGDESSVRAKAKKTPAPMRIVYAGQLIPLKNVDVLIRAVKNLSFDCHLTIVGDGPEAERLHALAGGVPEISFTGRLSREETVQKMGEADVFIMLSSPESYGLVYLEAMAQGCITVASRGEGFDGLIVDQENGFLEEPGSVEAAVRVLERIHRLDPETYRSIVEKGYAMAASMTEDQTARRMLEINV